MWLTRLPAAAFAAFALVILSAPAWALSNTPGGARAPALAQAGGSEYGVLASRPATARPTVARLSVPASAAPGPPPRVLLRIDEPGVASVEVRVAVTSLGARRAVLVVPLGWVPTGRTLTVRWPAHARLASGGYHVSLTARDPHGASLLRRARSSGVASLTVRAPAPPPVPAAPATPLTSEAPAAEAGVPTPAQTRADGAVFPVAGAHSFGGPENRFGAPREGHIHQGQDVLTAEGTPVLAPLPGAIVSTSYQAGGAGYYLVEHTGIGFDFMFAHCEASSFAVSEGQGVSVGQALCSAGQTGDATGPHLHFEIWVGGWQAPGGRPIDPLPYLEAWERVGAG
jgi:biotin carboxyl carrier protein